MMFWKRKVKYSALNSDELLAAELRNAISVVNNLTLELLNRGYRVLHALNVQGIDTKPTIVKSTYLKL